MDYPEGATPLEPIARFHPIGIERMLRIYFLRRWFHFSDPAAEEAIYDSLAMCFMLLLKFETSG